MLFLICAILCSSLVSIIMRASENKIKSNAGMFVFNYMICMILARIYIKDSGIFHLENKAVFTLILGLISGILYLVSFVLLQKSIHFNGIVLSSIFMKLGIIVSILIAIICFHDNPTMVQILGIIIAVISIIIINFQANHMHSNKIWLLFLLLLISGITDSMVNIYHQVGISDLNDTFLFYIFVFALICSIILYFLQKKKLCKWDVFFGILIGFPNYYSSRFLLLSLNDISAVIAYPIYSVATIIVITLSGVLLFREHLNAQKKLGLLFVLISLILLNL